MFKGLDINFDFVSLMIKFHKRVDVFCQFDARLSIGLIEIFHIIAVFLNLIHKG